VTRNARVTSDLPVQPDWEVSFLQFTAPVTQVALPTHKSCTMNDLHNFFQLDNGLELLHIRCIPSAL
jgi:hypothetical protein